MNKHWICNNNYVLSPCDIIGKSEEKIQKFWTNIHSVCNKSTRVNFQNFFSKPAQKRHDSTSLPHFFFKKNEASQIRQCFGKTGKKQWIFYFQYFLNLKGRFLRKSKANFCYSNMKDFDKILATNFWQNKRHLLLMKEASLF